MSDQPSNLCSLTIPYKRQVIKVFSKNESWTNPVYKFSSCDGAMVKYVCRYQFKISVIIKFKVSALERISKVCKQVQGDMKITITGKVFRLSHKSYLSDIPLLTYNLYLNISKLHI